MRYSRRARVKVLALHVIANPPEAGIRQKRLLCREPLVFLWNSGISIACSPRSLIARCVGWARGAVADLLLCLARLARSPAVLLMPYMPPPMDPAEDHTMASARMISEAKLNIWPARSALRRVRVGVGVGEREVGDMLEKGFVVAA